MTEEQRIEINIAARDPQMIQVIGDLTIAMAHLQGATTAMLNGRREDALTRNAEAAESMKRVLDFFDRLNDAANGTDDDG